MFHCLSAMPSKIISFLLILLLGVCATTTNGESSEDYSLCEDQLQKYRRFVLHAILSFEDVCDSALAEQRPGPLDFLKPFRQERTDVWSFVKLLMSQFNDMDFIGVIKDAILDKCQGKMRLRVNEKRDAVLLGKKQRFHSWGGK